MLRDRELRDKCLHDVVFHKFDWDLRDEYLTDRIVPMGDCVRCHSTLSIDEKQYEMTNYNILYDNVLYKHEVKVTGNVYVRREHPRSGL